MVHVPRAWIKWVDRGRATLCCRWRYTEGQGLAPSSETAHPNSIQEKGRKKKFILPTRCEYGLEMSQSLKSRVFEQGESSPVLSRGFLFLQIGLDIMISLVHTSPALAQSLPLPRPGKARRGEATAPVGSEASGPGSPPGARGRRKLTRTDFGLGSGVRSPRNFKVETEQDETCWLLTAVVGDGLGVM